MILPETLQVLGGWTFSGCTSLSSIVVPNSLVQMGYGAFYGCNNLESITLPFIGSGNSNEQTNKTTAFGCLFGSSINACYFNYSADQNIPVKLKTVTVTGSNVKANSFYRCVNITTVILTDSVTEIGNSAFGNCTSLSSISVSDNLQKIGDGAFYNCVGITDFTICSQVNYVGGNAFKGCSSLAIVNFENTDGWITYYVYDKEGTAEAVSSDKIDQADQAAYYLINANDMYCMERQ